jgi:Bacterial EndoU nuclease
MKSLRIAVLSVLTGLAILCALAGTASARRASALRDTPALSDTSPPVNLSHVFEGEVNRKGRPVGFHARPGGRNPAGARVVRIVDRPNRQGVYTAEVEIRGGEGRWLRKRSTFYPDRMSRADVIAAILNAYKRRSTGRAEQFRGPSGQGFTIEGWYQNGRINTAYPIFQ